MATLTSADVFVECVKANYSGIVEIPDYIISVPVNNCVCFKVDGGGWRKMIYVWIDVGGPYNSNFPVGAPYYKEDNDGYYQCDQLCEDMNRLLEIYKVVAI